MSQKEEQNLKKRMTMIDSHKAVQELLCTHGYRERTVGDKIPRRMLVKEITAALYPGETFNTKCSDCNGCLKCEKNSTRNLS